MSQATVTVFFKNEQGEKEVYRADIYHMLLQQLFHGRASFPFDMAEGCRVELDLINTVDCNNKKIELEPPYWMFIE